SAWTARSGSADACAPGPRAISAVCSIASRRFASSPARSPIRRWRSRPWSASARRRMRVTPRRSRAGSSPREKSTGGARHSQARHELEQGLEQRVRDQNDAAARIAEIEAELGGLAAGLDGLLESEASQRERVVTLQKKMQAAREQVQAGDEAARAKRFEQTEL